MRRSKQQQDIPLVIQTALQRLTLGTATEADHRVLREWYRSFEDEEIIIPVTAGDGEAELDQRLRQRLELILSQDKRPMWRRWAPYAAAMLLMGITAWAWYFVDSGRLVDGQTNMQMSASSAQDFNPGGNRALLTLADGTTVELSETQGTVMIDANRVSYSDGSVIQELLGAESALENPVAAAHADVASLGYHTITTPRKGQYQVMLPDGTKVWLNAQTTLRYPVRFAEDGREVTLEGEAFFEVASVRGEGDPNQRGVAAALQRQTASGRVPFRVIAKGHTVEVLGTQFNIHAYPDEYESSTTLIEGAVQVKSSDGAKIMGLKPGEQILVATGKFDKKKVDVAPFVAWKDNLFMFDREPLESIMKKVARWYDVEVVFEEDYLRNQLISGSVSRFGNASEVLETLALTELATFHIHGGKIIVRPPTRQP